MMFRIVRLTWFLAAIETRMDQLADPQDTARWYRAKAVVENFSHDVFYAAIEKVFIASKNDPMLKAMHRMEPELFFEGCGEMLILFLEEIAERMELNVPAYRAIQRLEA